MYRNNAFSFDATSMCEDSKGTDQSRNVSQECQVMFQSAMLWFKRYKTLLREEEEERRRIKEYKEYIEEKRRRDDEDRKRGEEEIRRRRNIDKAYLEDDIYRGLKTLSKCKVDQRSEERNIHDVEISSGFVPVQRRAHGRTEESNYDY